MMLVHYNAASMFHCSSCCQYGPIFSNVVYHASEPQQDEQSFCCSAAHWQTDTAARRCYLLAPTALWHCSVPTRGWAKSTPQPRPALQYTADNPQYGTQHAPVAQGRS